MRRALVGGAAAAFLVVLAVTFPTDLLLRRLVTSAAPGIGIVWEHAHLRPWGVRFEHAVVRAPGETVAVVLDEVELTPSLSGLLRGRRGSPWQVGVRHCQGAADGIVDASRDAIALDLTWRDVDLARCGLGALGGGAIAGRAEGSARLRIASAGTSGDGAITIHDASWRASDRAILGSQLAAATARAHWQLAHGQLRLEAISLVGPDYQASGGGEVDLAPEPAASRVRLRLAVGTASAGAPTWPLAVEGTLANPRLVTP